MEESVAQRSGASAVITRLSELMFLEVVRDHLASLPREEANWLAGVRDPVVGRARAHLHDRPEKPWTLPDLERACGVSRSVLAERFAHFIGQPPMAYLARWRMQVAAGLLKRTGDKIATVAEEVGYGSEAAFCRAFKRETGVPPATWRRKKARG